jgi:hypothetical protein
VISPFDGWTGINSYSAGAEISASTLVRLGALAQQLNGIAANATTVASAAAAVSAEHSVWAIPTGARMSETLSVTTGTISPGTALASANGRLGIRSFGTFTGGGGAYEHPWSAMAFWTGSSFAGIIVNIWTGDTINASNVRSANARPIFDAASQFYPTTGDNLYRHVLPILIQPSGYAVVFDAQNTGYQYSSAQNPSANGYYSTSFFSQDDGVWGIQPDRLIDGDAPGLALTTGGYGFNNYNGTEPVLSYYWGGPVQASANFVGIVFSA